MYCSTKVTDSYKASRQSSLVPLICFLSHLELLASPPPGPSTSVAFSWTDSTDVVRANSMAHLQVFYEPQRSLPLFTKIPREHPTFVSLLSSPNPFSLFGLLSTHKCLAGRHALKGPLNPPIRGCIFTG